MIGPLSLSGRKFIKEYNPMTQQESGFPSAIDLTGYSQKLLDQVDKTNHFVDLTGQGALFSVTHPALIKTDWLYQNYPHELILKEQVSGWYFKCYQSLDAALASHPNNIPYSGFPFGVFQFLNAPINFALLDFKHLGVIFLSKNPFSSSSSSPALLHHQLSQWLNYALSPQLWGPSGKWTRFHQRLVTLFTNYGLLLQEDFPGFYSLSLKGQWLQKYGFRGKISDHSFDLIFPWDFSLTQLNDLESVLARGP
jgi:hypothetical protein